MANDLAVIAPAQGGAVIVPDTGGSIVSQSMPGPSAVTHAKANQGASRDASSYAGIKGITISDEDRAAFDELGQGLGKTGEQVFDLMARAMITGDEEDAAEWAEQDAKDRAETNAALKREWGFQYKTNVTLANKYLDSLPPAVQMVFETADIGGMAALNSPAVLKWLVEQARGPVASHSNTADEKAQIEELMRQPGSKYWQGPEAARMQARYRDLIGSAPADKPLPTGSGVDREIEEIQNIMRTDRTRYNRDTRMQARFLQLLQQKHS